MASWYVFGNNQQSMFTPPVNVTVGQALTGVISLTGSSGSAYNYQTSFNGIAGTFLSVSGIEELVWATETLEAYYVEEIGNYPSNPTASVNSEDSPGAPERGREAEKGRRPPAPENPGEFNYSPDLLWESRGEFKLLPVCSWISWRILLALSDHPEQPDSNPPPFHRANRALTSAKKNINDKNS